MIAKDLPNELLILSTDLSNVLSNFSDMIYVLLGGLITFFSVIYTERIHLKKEKKNKKLALYYGLHTALVSYVRQLQNVLRLELRMHFYMQKYVITKEDPIERDFNKEQYLIIINQMLEARRVRTEYANVIDNYITEFYTMFGKDSRFDELVDLYKHAKKPLTDIFKEENDSNVLSQLLKRKLNEISKFAKDLREEKLNYLDDYLKVKLKIQKI